MAKFRYRGTDEGYLAVGFTQLYFVQPDDVFHVDDTRKDSRGETDADAYRNVPELYEELPGEGPVPQHEHDYEPPDSEEQE